MKQAKKIRASLFMLFVGVGFGGGIQFAQAAGLAVPVITSDTHPDEAGWYNRATARFHWPVPSGMTEVRLVLGTKRSSLPRVSYIPAINEKTVSGVADGIWYFNAQFFAGTAAGPVTSFRFNVDTKPPLPFFITRADRTSSTNPSPEVSFSTTDALSGLHHYEVQVDNGEWRTVDVSSAGKSYVLPKLTPGDHTVTVRAIDKAGNITIATTVVSVTSISAPLIDTYPSEVQSDEVVSLGGKALANSTVFIYATPIREDTYTLSTNPPVSYRSTATTSGAGIWKGQLAHLLTGTYHIYAYVQDERGALSSRSNAVTVAVKHNAFLIVWHFLQRLLTGILYPGTWWFIASLLFYLLLLIALVEWLFHWLHFFFWGYWVRRKPKVLVAVKRRGDDKLRTRLELLLRDITEELLVISKLGHNRPLYPEEKYLKSKLVQYQKSVKAAIADAHKRLAKKKK